MHLGEILVPLGLFAAIVLSLYFYFSARHKERMALIDKGLLHKRPPSKRSTNIGLKAGTLLIGLSIGLFVGYLLSEYTTIEDVVAYFTMILLFGGLSLVFNNFIPAKPEKEIE